MRIGGKRGFCNGPGPTLGCPWGPVVVVLDVVVLEVVELVVLELVVLEVVVLELVVELVVVVEVVVEAGGPVVLGAPMGMGGGSGPAPGVLVLMTPTAGVKVTGVAASAASDSVAVVVRVPKAEGEIWTTAEMPERATVAEMGKGSVGSQLSCAALRA